MEKPKPFSNVGIRRTLTYLKPERILGEILGTARDMRGHWFVHIGV